MCQYTSSSAGLRGVAATEAGSASSAALLKQGSFSSQALAPRATREGAVLSAEELQAAILDPKKHQERLPLPFLSQGFSTASHHHHSLHLQLIVLTEVTVFIGLIEDLKKYNLLTT